MYKRIHVALILCLLCMSYISNAQTKRAIVIGIGEQEDTAWNKINGDKDVPYVLEILEEAGYGQVITCVNEQATKSGIISAFRKLIQSCDQGDVVYVHYSGHGQQMRDTGIDEPDDLDECWIPYDAYRKPCEKDRGEKHLRDDEINVLLTDIRNKLGNEGKMLVVIDACHSGDATRGNNDTIRGVDDVFDSIKSCLSNLTHDSNRNIHRERWITLSACESDQVNVEMKKPVVGKLTYSLYTLLKAGDLGDNNVFFRKLRIFINMNTINRPQKPTMTGETDKYDIVDILR